MIGMIVQRTKITEGLLRWKTKLIFLQKQKLMYFHKMDASLPLKYFLTLINSDLLHAEVAKHHSFAHSHKRHKVNTMYHLIQYSVLG